MYERKHITRKSTKHTHGADGNNHYHFYKPFEKMYVTG